METEDGETFLARTAVVSSIHVKSLVGMAPAAAWGDEFLDGVDTFDPGMPSFASYYATSEPPRFPVGEVRPGPLVSAGYVPWPEDTIEFGRGIKEGRLHNEGAFLLFATPTLVDPSRAPQDHHTVKILSMAPYELTDGTWEDCRDELAARHFAVLQRCAPNLTDDKVLAPGEEPGRHRAVQPAHVARHHPRRRPRSGQQRPAPPGARGGPSTDAHRRALPDRRHHPPRWPDNRRSRPQRRHGHSR